MSLSSIFVMGAFAYLLWAAALFVMQRSMMFPGASLATSATDRSSPQGVESVPIPFSGGTVEGWFVGTSASAPSPAIIFAHGNAEIIDYGLRDALAFSGLGAAVLLVEYPGYRRSDGSPSRESIGEVFLAAYDWLANRSDVDGRRIAGFGRSLGSGAIGDLSRQRPLKALVLQSPFASVAHFARQYRVPSFLIRDDFDNVAAVSDFAGPVLLIHGVDDAIIPFAHSEQLAAISPDVELVPLDCSHNDCPPDWAEFLAVLHDFLQRSGVVSPNTAPQ